LDGQKIWITNGGIADVMTVFAKTALKGSDGSMVEKVGITGLATPSHEIRLVVKR